MSKRDNILEDLAKAGARANDASEMGGENFVLSFPFGK
jgi:hypothetical protein